MSTSICGIDCTSCGFKDSCAGCAQTGGKPFGGTCMAAECCKHHPSCSCGDFPKRICALKRQLIEEFNALGIEDMEEVTDLYSLAGFFINQAYPLPGGQSVKLWDDHRVYLGNQLHKKNSDRCYGIAADEEYLLVSEYGDGGSDARIVVFKRREKREAAAD